MSSLRGRLIKCFAKASQIFSTKNIGIFEIVRFEIFRPRCFTLYCPNKTKKEMFEGQDFLILSRKICCQKIQYIRNTMSLGNFNEYTQYTIFNMKKKKHSKLSQICRYGRVFQGTQEQVRSGRGKQAISVQAIEVLYVKLHYSYEAVTSL